MADREVYGLGGQIEQQRIIDVTDSEALLVRKNNDGGDILVVDTDNGVIAFGGVTPVPGTRITLPLENDPLTPTLAFGDGDTGMYQQTNGELQFSANGLLKMHFTGAGFVSGNANGFFLRFKTSSPTTPTFAPCKIDEDTGIGWGGTDQLSLIAGGVECMRFIESTGVLQLSQVTAGITADVGSAQGDGVLTSSYNEISVCVNIGDAVTLPLAIAGYKVTIINNGAQSCDVFPANGNDCGGGVNTAVALAAGSNITYFAFDATNWESI